MGFDCDDFLLLIFMQNWFDFHELLEGGMVQDSFFFFNFTELPLLLLLCYVLKYDGFLSDISWLFPFLLFCFLYPCCLYPVHFWISFQLFLLSVGSCFGGELLAGQLWEFRGTHTAWASLDWPLALVFTCYWFGHNHSPCHLLFLH